MNIVSVSWYTYIYFLAWFDGHANIVFYVCMVCQKIRIDADYHRKTSPRKLKHLVHWPLPAVEKFSKFQVIFKQSWLHAYYSLFLSIFIYSNIHSPHVQWFHKFNCILYIFPMYMELMSYLLFNVNEFYLFCSIRMQSIWTFKKEMVNFLLTAKSS